MKNFLIPLCICSALVTSYSSFAAISSEGWFYKYSYTHAEGYTAYGLKGAYESKKACNDAILEASTWATVEIPVMGSCKFYYTDAYNAIEDKYNLWGIKADDWNKLDSKTQAEFINTIDQLETIYDIESFQNEVNQLIERTINDDDENGDEDHAEQKPANS